jgi:two-component system cell cycle sensor histidine kinase/response regulator CckA
VEEEIRRQRREAIVEFSGDVAHDISNPLQAILGFAEFMRAQHKDNPAIMEDVEEILQATARAGALIKQLLIIGGRHRVEPKPSELSLVLEPLREKLLQAAGEKVRVEWRIAPTGREIPLDPAAVGYIIDLLCAHARDTMPEGGTVTLSAEAVTAGDPAGDYVRLTVQDTGPGFDPALAGRALEPFFLKHLLRRGRGLDLAVVRALVEQHGGFVDVETRPGSGTTFGAYFPCRRP